MSYNKEYYKKRQQDPHIRAKHVEYQQNYMKRLKQKIIDRIGDKCVICGADKKYWHEIHGKKHVTGNIKYTLDNIDDFVCLCWHCHTGVHWLMSVFGKSWDEIYTLK